MKDKQALLLKAQRAWKDQVTELGVEILDNLKDEELTSQFNKEWIEGLKIRMQWVAFPVLPEEKEGELISNHLLIPLFDDSFELEKVFRLKELLENATTWTEAVPKFLEAFLKNEERLGTQSITLKRGQVKPTVANWLRSYAETYGMDKHGEIAVTRFMSRSPNAATLSASNRKALEKLLLLFESIKLFTIEQILKETEKILKEDKKAVQVKEKKAKTPQALRRSPLGPSAGSKKTPRVAQERPAASPEVPLIHQKAASSRRPNQPPPVTTQRTIREALQKNPQIANQQITSQPLEILGRGNNLAPTVQNWLLDYRSRVGAEGNTEEDRHEFLQKSLNVQKLGEKERSFVKTLIESYDNNQPISISEEDGRIVFE